MVVENSYQGIFLANIHSAVFNRLDMSIAEKEGTKNHGIYLERDVRNVVINNLKVSGGLGQPIHMYMDYGDWGDNVLIDGIEATTIKHGVVVIQRYRNVTIRNGVLHGSNNEPVVKLYSGVTNCVFENLDCWGGKLYEAQGNNAGCKFINCKLNGVLVKDTIF
jgi:hypothetical protein